MTYQLSTKICNSRTSNIECVHIVLAALFICLLLTGEHCHYIQPYFVTFVLCQYILPYFMSFAGWRALSIYSAIFHDSCKLESTAGIFSRIS